MDLNMYPQNCGQCVKDLKLFRINCIFNTISIKHMNGTVVLTHWGRVCVTELTIIGSDNGLPDWWQAIL